MAHVPRNKVSDAQGDGEDMRTKRLSGRRRLPRDEGPRRTSHPSSVPAASSPSCYTQSRRRPRTLPAPASSWASARAGAAGGSHGAQRDPSGPGSHSTLQGNTCSRGPQV